MHELEPSPRQANIIGIDLGTEFTTVARFNEAGRAEITNNSEGGTQTPSVIQIDESGEVIVGTEAKKLVGQGRENVFAEFKRDMGTDKLWQVRDRQITPEHLTSILLKRVVQDYTEQFGEPCTIAITWPANFREEQREATKSAARIAGLRNVFFIEDPTAVAHFYANETPLNGKYVIFDLGQSTLDITLLDAAGDNIAIIYHGGIQNLGLKDVDRALLEIIKGKLERKNGEKLGASDDFLTKYDLDKGRDTLCQNNHATLKLVSIKHGLTVIKVTPGEFMESVQRLVDQAELACEYALRCAQKTEAGIVRKPDIKGVFMTGCGSNVPAFQGLMQKMFGMNPQLKELEHTKALGAAIYAALNTDSGSLTPLQRMSGGHDSGITFVSQHFLGVAYVDWLTNQWLNHTVIHKDEKLPVSRTYRVKTNTLGHLQPFKLTQSAAEETNPDFTKILWGGAHTLFAPLSEIDLTFGYDANGTANASMTEVATGQRTQIDLHSSQNE